MPHNLKEHDARMVECLQSIYDEATRTNPSGDPEVVGVSAMLNMSNFGRAQLALDGQDIAGLASRWEQLEKPARRQTVTVCESADTSMRILGATDEEIAHALRNSVVLGRQFGRLGYVRKLELGEEDVLKEIAANPVPWFSYHAEKQRIDFSAQAKEYFRSLYAPTIGCPVLATMIESPAGGHQSMYDMFWRRFSTDYADHVVMTRKIVPAGIAV